MTNTANASDEQLLGIRQIFLILKVLLSVSLTALLSIFIQAKNFKWRIFMGVYLTFMLLLFDLQGGTMTKNSFE